jgi:hypothetical protein
LRIPSGTGLHRVAPVSRPDDAGPRGPERGEEPVKPGKAPGRRKSARSASRETGRRPRSLTGGATSQPADCQVRDPCVHVEPRQRRASGSGVPCAASVVARCRPRLPLSRRTSSLSLRRSSRRAPAAASRKPSAEHPEGSVWIHARPRQGIPGTSLAAARTRIPWTLADSSRYWRRFPGCGQTPNQMTYPAYGIANTR